MPEKPSRSRDPEDKRSSAKPARAESPAGRTPKRGNSGYGIESLRPYLRDQLELDDLLRPGAIPSGTNKPKRSEG